MLAGLLAGAMAGAMSLAAAPAAHAQDLEQILGSAQLGSKDAGSSGRAPVVQAGDYDPFYDTATVNPRTPGEILRTADSPYNPMVHGPDALLPQTAQKILYTSTDMHGRPVGVTGYVAEPIVPWHGPGERPTVVIGRGTVGQGDQCAPSRNWPLDNQPDPIESGRAVAFEGLYDVVFLSQGVRVVVTDYVGMGTPGIHTYMNRAEQAHAMADAARAARNLVEGRGQGFGQVAFYGHSQGGGAAAAAVEAVSTYAPDLHVAGAYASAPPADLNEVQRHIDGSDLTGAIGLTINGLVERYPQLRPVLDANLDAAGRDALGRLAGQCTDELTTDYGGHLTSEWTADGRRLDALLADMPEAQRAMRDQFIGAGKPVAPTMIVAGRHDLNVEYQQSRDLAGNWCANGGQVVYRDDILPPIGEYNHFAQAVSGMPFGVPFLLDRFRGMPPAGACNA